MSKLLEDLVKYFKNTPKDIIDKDMKELDEYNQTGPDIICGVELISKERERQINEKGYTSEHDDRCYGNTLAMLAERYIFGSSSKLNSTDEERIVELSKAGALIAAEIDRLQRLK